MSGRVAWVEATEDESDREVSPLLAGQPQYDADPDQRTVQPAYVPAPSSSLPSGVGSGTGSGSGSGPGSGPGSGSGLDRVAGLLAAAGLDPKTAAAAAAAVDAVALVVTDKMEAATAAAAAAALGVAATPKDSVLSGSGERGLKEIPVRPPHIAVAIVGVTVVVLWLALNLVVASFALIAQFKSHVAGETCVHPVRGYLEAVTFHSLWTALLLAVYFVRVVSQLRSTHLQVQRRLLSDTELAHLAAGTTPAKQSQSVSLPIPFLFKESWSDVVLEYLLSGLLIGLVAIGVCGELTLAGIGLGPQLWANGCAQSAPILWGLACSISTVYSCGVVFLVVLAIRKLADHLVQP